MKSNVWCLENVWNITFGFVKIGKVFERITLGKPNDRFESREKLFENSYHLQIYQCGFQFPSHIPESYPVKPSAILGKGQNEDYSDALITKSKPEKKKKKWL